MWHDIIKRKVARDMIVFIDNIMDDGKKRTMYEIKELLHMAVDERRKIDIGYKGQFIPHHSRLLFYLKQNYSKEKNENNEFLFWK